MLGVVIVIHAMICLFLVTVILMQAGRGGGLTEGFQAAESVFGAKTSSFMVKTTTILAVIFFTTSLTVAILSSKHDESLMLNRGQSAAAPMKLPSDAPLTDVNALPATVPAPEAAVQPQIPALDQPSVSVTPAPADNSQAPAPSSPDTAAPASEVK